MNLEHKNFRNEVFQALKTLIQEMPLESLYDLQEHIVTAVKYELVSEDMADELSAIMAERTAWISAEDLFD